MDKKDKGTSLFDSWETIKIILDKNPTLKQRVLNKIHELRAAMEQNGRKPKTPPPVDSGNKKN